VRFGQDSFETLLGRPIPLNPALKKGSYSLNTPLSEMTDSFIGRQLYKLMRDGTRKSVIGKEDTPTAVMILRMAEEMPLRSLLMSGGMFDRQKLEALLLMANGHFLKGLRALIGMAIKR